MAALQEFAVDHYGCILECLAIERLRGVQYPG